MPRLKWDAAFDMDGNEVELDLQDIHCGEQFQTLTIVMGALWCPACPEYLSMLAQQADALTGAGMGFIFMEVENNGRQLASNRESYGYLQGHIPNTPGWRVGDRDTRPSPLIQMSPTVGGFPAAFVVRVRDMMVVADQGATTWRR